MNDNKKGVPLTGVSGDGLEGLRAGEAAIEKMRLSAQRELALVKQLRAETERYRQEIETKARSQAQLLILQARLATQKEIEVIRKARAEIQKVLADVRVTRIAAQEELETLRKFTWRKFTSDAQIRALSGELQAEDGQRPETEKEAVGV